ncbi:aa3-type cytochrome oxidase subunit CtaJ [Motilibacter peucedani]|uniref:aa3-type cytochrome oxidase subunit CtaJ n=1 Tax=Motilibacter peucedani TaxID=598650 RepID=UPI001E2EDAD6|nr:hypothetical protein [Motilibacter peucedani]
MTHRAHASAPGSAAILRRSFRRRLGAAYAAVLPLLALATASPAFAETHRSDGDDPGSGIGVLQTIGVYIGIPLAVYLVVALLTFAPSTTRGPRYRPGAGWDADATWLGGPTGKHAAPDADTPRAQGSGGASGSW